MSYELPRYGNGQSVNDSSGMVGIEVVIYLHRDLERIMTKQFRYGSNIESLLNGKAGKGVAQMMDGEVRKICLHSRREMLALEAIAL